MLQRNLFILRKNICSYYAATQTGSAESNRSHTFEEPNCVHSEAMGISKFVSRYKTAIPMWDIECSFPGGKVSWV